MAGSTSIQIKDATIQFGTLNGSAFTAGNVKIVGSPTSDQLEITSTGATVITASVIAVSSAVGMYVTGPAAASNSVVIGGGSGNAPASPVGSLTAGGGMLVKDESSGTNWFLHVHGDRIRLFNGTVEHSFITTTDTSAVASTVIIGANNTSNANYQVLFGSGNSVYSSSLVLMNPGTGLLTATSISGAGRGGTISGFSKVYNAVWNDYADYITVEEATPIVPGKAYVYANNQHYISTRYAERGALGLCSDTFSFVAGQKTGKNQLALAVAGFVLAYVDKVYSSGTPLVCTKDGKLSRANLLVRLFTPERILATFYKIEPQSSWNGIQVLGRSWVKVI